MVLFISFVSGAVFFYLHRFFPFLSLFMFLAGIAVLFFKGGPRAFERRRLLHGLVAFLVAASGFSYAQRWYTPSPSYGEFAGEILTVRGLARSEAAPSGSQGDLFSQVIAVEKAVSTDGRLLNAREIRLVTVTPLLPGREYLIETRMPRDVSFMNPGSDKNIPSAFALEIKEVSTPAMGFFQKARSRLNGYIRGTFSPESSSFLLSQITGERGFLTREIKNAFNVTGLAHLLSISGTHFGLLFFVLFRVFRALILVIPYRVLVRLTLYVTPSQVSALLCIPFMIGYLGISDMSIPAVRSFIMITLFLFGLLIQRKGFWLNTVLFAAAVIVLIQPDSLLDLSFQLSFLAVISIGIVAEKMRQKPQRGGPPEADDQSRKRAHSLYSRVFSFIETPVFISVAASAGTAPLVAYYYHYVSVISPLTNLIITPIVGFIILPLCLASSFVFLLFDYFPLQSLIETLTTVVLAAIRSVARWNFVEIKIPAFPPALLVTFYLGLFVYVVLNLRGLPSPSRLGREEEGEEAIGKRILTMRILLPIALALLPFVLYTAFILFQDKGMRITYLDVGQGDAAVMELPDKRTFVVDTGRSGFQVSEFLKYRGIKAVDALVLSHSHPDHSGGMEHLINTVDVAEVWDNNRLSYSLRIAGLKHRGLQRGDRVEGLGYGISVLHPYEGFYTMHSQSDEANNDSLVLKIEARLHTFLLSGDIGREAEDDLVHLKGYLKSTVLKVPHHGSRSSLSEDFYRLVNPDIAVISAGRNNLYGHPHRDTLAMLTGAKILRTDRDGAIGIRELSNGRLEVRTWGDFQIAEARTLSDELINIERLFRVW